MHFNDTLRKNLRDVYLWEFCIVVLNIASCSILYAPYTWLTFSMTGVHSGIQWNIFFIPPPPPSSLPVHRADLGSQRQKEYRKSLISENDQIDRSPISRARYLYRVSTKCCQSFSILVKDTIISEVNLQNLQFMKFYPCYSVNIVYIKLLLTEQEVCMGESWPRS